jgi:hypothetical protein
MTVAILDQVQMLDQQIAPTRARAKERTYFVKRVRLDLATLWRARRPASTHSAAAVARRILRRLGERHFFLLAPLRQIDCKTLEIDERAIV